MKVNKTGAFGRAVAGTCLIAMLSLAALATSGMFLPPSATEQAAMVPNCNNHKCTPFQSTSDPNKIIGKCVETPDLRFNCETLSETKCKGGPC